jgi:hypothetical protein
LIFGLMELKKRINLSIEEKVINGNPGYFAYVAYNSVGDGYAGTGDCRQG